MEPYVIGHLGEIGSSNMASLIRRSVPEVKTRRTPARGTLEGRCR